MRDRRYIGFCNPAIFAVEFHFGIEVASSSLWQRFQRYLLEYPKLGFSLDISKTKFPDDLFEKMRPQIEEAFAAMQELEAGAIANLREKRMVGHYWLRGPVLAPTGEIRSEIEETIRRIKTFAENVHSGKISAEDRRRFKHLLHIGIGGSALGPQFVSAAPGSRDDPMDIFFFDNTDPEGFDRVFERIGEGLPQTLVIVVSKSGGTKEIRNGMVEAEAKFAANGLRFARHAVAVTGVGSELDKHAGANGWLARFPMPDWIGGRTSAMSAVGLLPMALQGFDIDAFLAGAAAMDERTRVPDRGAKCRHASRSHVVSRRQRKRREGHGRFPIQISPGAVYQISPATRDGIVRQRKESRGRNCASGHCRVRQ
jgi:glucose-6-phosphate isomerase